MNPLMGSLGFDEMERQFKNMEFRGDSLKNLDEASVVGDHGMQEEG